MRYHDYFPSGKLGLAQAVVGLVSTVAVIVWAVIQFIRAVVA